MLLLTSNFPKLQLVLNPTSLGTPLLLQGIADWLPIVAGLSHDQVQEAFTVQILLVWSAGLDMNCIEYNVDVTDCMVKF